MTTYVKTNSDSGAPAVTGQANTGGATAGSLPAIRWFLVTICGWAESYTSGTGIAVFRPPDLSGKRFYLYVDDTAVTWTYLRGYETWSGASGTNPFPTVAQHASGVRLKKSNTTDATARSWKAAGNGKFFVFLPYDGYSTNTSFPMAFGDFISWLPGDGYNTILIAQSSSLTNYYDNGLYVKSANNSCYVARGRDQSTKSVLTSLDDFNNYNYTSSAAPFTGLITYPDPVTGGALVSPVAIASESAVRGVLPGIWSHSHRTQSFPNPLTGVVGIPSKSFQPWNIVTTSSSVSTSMLIETTAWDNDA